MVKYEEIANEMRRRIEENVYPLEQPIPKEVSLAEEFKCSRMTMKRALDMLVSEGILLRKRGHGTFIIPRPKNDQEVNVISEENMGLSNLIKNRKVDSKIITFQIQFPPHHVAEKLGISSETPVYYIIRLRYVDEKPYVIEITYMPVTLIPGISEKVLLSSIYNHIQGPLQLKIGATRRNIRAAKSTELEQKHLDCKVDDPILEVEQIGYLNDGIPFEYSFSRHRYDKFVFTTVAVART